MEKIGNWGRWGPDDEIGALNLIGAAEVRAALARVQAGKIYNLSIPINHKTPMPGMRPAPILVMTRDGGDLEPLPPSELKGAAPRKMYPVTDDLLIMATQTGTHIDALSHVAIDGKLYNGFSARTVTSRGARRCGIEKIGGVVTTGVLLDMPKLLGIPALAADVGIDGAMMQAAAKAAGMDRLPSGCAVLVRTGWPSLARNAREFAEFAPGLTAAAVDWLRDNDVALVGSDTMGVELTPSGDVDNPLPVHQAAIWELGIHLIEMMDLEQLAADGVGAFAFMISPLPIQGAIGSPLAPLAIV